MTLALLLGVVAVVVIVLAIAGVLGYATAALVAVGCIVLAVFVGGLGPTRRRL